MSNELPHLVPKSHTTHSSDNLHFLTGGICLPLLRPILNAQSFAGMVDAAWIVDEFHFVSVGDL